MLLPGNHEGVCNDISMLSEPLPADVTELLDTMEEAMLTAWETNEETHGDDN